MIALVNAPCFTSTANLQTRFLAICTRIERHARLYFRTCKCPVKKEDRVAETVALTWKWFLRLAEKGKDATQFPSTLASFAARAVKSGRRLCGQLKSRDTMSELAQQRNGFSVQSLPVSTRTAFHELLTKVGGQGQLDEFEEFLQHNSQTPIPDLVVFRFDWPAWLKTRTQRDRRIIAQMARSERTKDLAQKFALSPGFSLDKPRRRRLEWGFWG